MAPKGLLLASLVVACVEGCSSPVVGAGRGDAAVEAGVDAAEAGDDVAGCGSPPCVPPPNDTCAGAIALAPGAHASTLTADTRRASHDLDAPCAPGAGPDVFYSFHLDDAELVYADTVGADYDTVLFLASDCGTPLVPSGVAGLAECDHGATALGCAPGDARASLITAFLGPGDYLLVVSGVGGARGTTPVHVQRIPVGADGADPGAASLPPVHLEPGTHTHNASTGGDDRASPARAGLSTCYQDGSGQVPASGLGAGAEFTYFWTSCPESPGGLFTASSCNPTGFPKVLYEVNPGDASGACDRGPPDCTAGGELPAPGGGTGVRIAPGASLHALYVDGATSGVGGNFSVTVSRP